MRKLIKENKNSVFLITYAIIIGVIAFNYSLVLDIFVFLLQVLTPLFYAIAMAFIINLPMRWIEKQCKRIGKNNSLWQKATRSVSLIITLIAIFITLYVMMAIVLPKVYNSLNTIFQNFGKYLSDTTRNIDKLFKDLNWDIRVSELSAIKQLENMSWDSIFSRSISMIGNLAGGVINNVVSFAGSFFQWLLAFFLSIYLLAGKERFILQMRKVVLAFTNTQTSELIFEIGAKTNHIFSMFVGGQLVDCAIKGVIFYIVFIILQYPMPELMAIIIMLCSIVPVFGPITAMIVDFILLLALKPGSSIWFIIIFQVLTNLESNIIYPKIVGNSIGLPGIWVLLSIFVFGGIYGVTGMLLAVPFTALAYILFTEYVHKRLAQKGIFRKIEDKDKIKAQCK